MIAIRFVSSRQFNSQPDGKHFTCTIQNPLVADFAGVGAKGDVLEGDSGSTDPDQRHPLGPNCVLSIDQNGNIGVRKPGTAGPDELFTLASGFMTFEPQPGVTYQVPCAVVS